MIEQKIVRNIYNSWGFTGSKITNVLCSDGKFRTFTASAEADTFFTTPGSIKVKGKSVSGFVWHDNMIWDEAEFPDGLWKFTAYGFKKNGHLLPEWKKNCSGCHKDIEWGEEVNTFSFYYYHVECAPEQENYDVYR